MSAAQINLRDPTAVAELFERAAQAMRAAPLRDKSIVRLPAPRKGRLIVTGDLHDNPVHLEKILNHARLGESTDHHVVLHEIIHGERLINGLDLSHRMLARVAELMLQFPNQVHQVLANHELSQMTGRGVSKGAGNSVVLFNDGLEYVFGDDAETVADAIRQFIAAMPLALITQNGVLCAHSLPAPHMMDSFDIDVINRELKPEDFVPPLGSAHLMVWGRQHTAAQIEDLAAKWNVKLFCLGHEHVETGIEARGERLLLFNSDHDRGAALAIGLDCQPPSVEDAVMMALRLS